MVANVMARGAEADAGGTYISKVCREYRQDKDKRLHLKYQLTDGSVREYWADIEKFHSDRDFKDAFQIIKSYAEQCLKGLATRFGPVAAVLSYQIFSPRWAYNHDQLFQAAQDLPKFWELPEKNVFEQLRHGFAIRDAVLKEDSRLKKERAHVLWERVLQSLPLNFGDEGRQMIVSFLVAQPQSASCERGFALIEDLRNFVST